MATYSVQAIHSVERAQGSTAVVLSMQTKDVLLTVEDDTTAIGYGIAETTAVADLLDWSNSQYLSIQASGSDSVTPDEDAASFIFSSQRGSDRNTIVILQAPVEDDDTFQSFIFNVAGPSLPFVTSQAQTDAYFDSLTGLTSTLFPDPGPGNSISLGTSNISFATDDDVFVFDDSAQWHNVGRGNDSIDGGGGEDMLSFVNVKTALTIDMAAGTATGAGVAHNFQNFEGVTGSVRGDYITGDDGDNRIRALGDYDWLIDSAGSDSYDGGNGRDMVSFIESSEGVTIYLEFGKRLNNPAEQDTFTSIERITGSSFEDIFYGSQGEDDFRGMGGYDTFYGSGGRDRYDGGSGIDTVNYFREAGVFNGFEGSAPVSEGVVASLLLGRGSAGNAARDLYTSIENLSGTMHNDVLTGDHGRNVLFGAQGDDTLIGNGGVDRLIGSSGTNILDGGSGWDYAIFDFDQSDYDWSTIAGVTTVSLTTEFTTFSYESTDTLTNIEVLSFADGDVIL